MGRHSAPLGGPADPEPSSAHPTGGAHRSAATGGSGPHRRRWLFVVLAIVILIGGTVAAVALTRPDKGHPSAATPPATPITGASCSAASTQSTPVSIAATPAIAGVIGTVAQQSCIPVLLRTVDGDAGATELTQHLADVWIPDSVERGYEVNRLATNEGSTATGPLVLVGAPGGASGASTTWSALVPKTPGGSSPALQVVQPTTSSADLAVAGPMAKAAAATLHDADLGYGVTATALGRVVDVAPNQAADPVPANTMRFVEARTVTAHTGTPILLTDGVAQLDYPWFTSRKSAADPTLAPLIDALRMSVTGPDGDAARHAAGLLAPGSTSVTLPDGRHQPVLAPAKTTDVPLHYGMTDPGNDNGNTTVLVDVSGSMFDPGPGGASVIDAVRASALAALGLFFGNSRLGLWYFAYKLVGEQDYQVTVPLGPLAETKSKIVAAVDGLRTGVAGTALYSTVLAAYRAQQAHYVAGAVNAIAVFTDGRDEDDPHRIDLATLLAQLHGVVDPKRPVSVLMFAFGSADVSAMTQIVGVTGGGVYPISNPQQVSGAVVRAAGATVQRAWG